MTEQEWLDCGKPHKMLDLLGCICSRYWRAMQHNVDVSQLHGLRLKKVSARKLHLLACGCCRRYWEYLHDARSRRAIEVLERYADGLAGAEELAQAARGARDAAEGRARDESSRDALEAVFGAVHTYAGAVEEDSRLEPLEGIDAVLADTGTAFQVAWAPAAPLLSATDDAKAWNAAVDRESAFLCHLIRDVFGNPFLPGKRMRAAWLSWNDGAIHKLAQAIYGERSFERLPILADALEEAGCMDADLLNHCRQPGEHVRGCWLVDLVLGKS